MKRLGRLRLPLALLLFVGVLGATLFGCARLYLTSRHASAQVADQLQAHLGVPVRIDEVDVGLNSTSSLSRLQVFEADGERPETPWLTVDDVQADLSAVDVLGGSLPRRIELRGAAIDLRFDQDGQLLTRLPRPKPVPAGQPFPLLVLKQARLTLRQEGRTPLVIENIDLEGSDRDGALEFHGTVKDGYWGDWTATGAFQPAAAQMTLHLQTPPTQVTQEKLDRLPFVTPSVWQQVQLNGVTPVALELRFMLGEAGAHYRVELEPVNTDVRVTSIALHAEKASGQVIVEDRLVQLRNVKGRTADGDIALRKADLSFRQTPYDMTFDVGVAKVDLRKLPPSWKVPLAAAKRPMSLTGQAKLRVQVENGKARTSGDGDGRVEVVFAQQPLAINVRLTADTKGFHFLAPKLSPLEMLKLLAPNLGAVEQPQETAAEEPDDPPPAGPHPLANPLSQTAQSLRSAFGGVMNAGTKVMGQLNRWVKPVPGQAPTLFEANVSMKDADLEKLQSQFKIETPFTVRGKISFQMHAAMPIDAPNNLRAYKLNGTATSARLTVAGVEITQFSAKVHYDDGVLSLEELHGEFPDSDGMFAGTGKVQVAPQGNAAVNLRFERAPAKRGFALLPGKLSQGEGTVSGQFDALVPVKQLTEPKAWTATGTVRSDRLAVLGIALTKLSLGLSVKDGVAKVSDLKGEVEGGQVSGTAEATWAEGYPFKGHLEMKGADLAAVERLAPALGFTLPVTIPIRGSAGGTADFQGKLAPLSLTASGTAQAQDVAALVFVVFAVDAVGFNWSLDSDRAKVSDFAAKLYGGAVNGSAVVPLKETVGGDANFTIDGLQIPKLARTLPLLPFKTTGQISGTIKGTISAAVPGQGREMNATVDLGTSTIRVQGIAPEKLKATVNYRGGTAAYHLEGDVLGGVIDVQGKLPLAAEPPPADNPPQGRLRIEGVRLSGLGDALGMRELLAPLAGRLNVDVPYRHEGPDRLPVGTGSFSIRDLRWGANRLSERITGSVRLTGTELQMPNFSGELGEGALRGSVVLNLKEFDRSTYTLLVERVDAALLLLPFLSSIVESDTSPTSGPLIQGPVEIELRGRLGRQWTGEGRVGFTHGKMYGIDLGEWRLPIRLTFRPAEGTGQIDFSDNDAQFAQGRVQGRGTVYFGSELRAEGSFRFFEVNVPTLLKSAGEVGRLAGGRASGRLEFNGQNIHSLNDLNGSLNATFTQAQTLQLPVLDVIARFVAPGQSAMAFQKGTLKATLSRGVVSIKQLGMSNATLQLVVEGTMSLQGRVDLQATAATNIFGLSAPVLQLLAARVPPTGPVPIGLILEATSLLANRVVYLHVTGTVKNPSVHLEPMRMLTQEAIRFLMGQAVGVSTP